MEMAGQAMSSKDWLQVVDDAESEELVIIVGPLDLPANAGHHMIKQPPLLTGTLPVDGYLYGFEVEMLDGQGRPMTNRVLHHFNLIDPERRELFSPIARRLFAVGSETQPATMPRWLGIPLEQGQEVAVSAMFHNPTDTPYPGARLRVTLRYRKKGWIFPIGVYPVYVDVMGPVGAKEFDLPPGRYEHSWEGSPAISGRLLAVGGHLHDYAVALRFEDVTAGEVLWETAPVVGDDGHVAGVPVGEFWWKGGIKLSPDHRYRLTVIYDNPTGETIPGGGMGVLGGAFKPSEPWPEVDRADPAYVTNMETTQRTAEMRAMGMDGSHGGHAHGGSKR
jgi:hypothetical protein